MASSSTYLALTKKYKQEQVEYENLITQINSIIRGIPDLSSQANEAISLVENGAVIGNNDIIAHEELKIGKSTLEGLISALNELVSEVRKAKENSANLEKAAMQNYYMALAREQAYAKLAKEQEGAAPQGGEIK